MFYYEDGAFRSFTKEQLIGFTEFLCMRMPNGPILCHTSLTLFLITANTGGLLGLFMGFSVVSLIEIIYFMSLRPYCARKRYMKHVSGIARAPPLANGRLFSVDTKPPNFANVVPMTATVPRFVKPLENVEKIADERQPILATFRNRAAHLGRKINAGFKEKISGLGNFVEPIRTGRQEYVPRYPYTE